MEGPQFLKKKYELHKTPEVEAAAKRQEERTGEKVSQRPDERIQAYLDRLKNVFDPEQLKGHENFDRRERNIKLLKNILHDKFVIKPEDIPEAYYEAQRRIAREQGHGDIELLDEQRAQLAEIVITDQKGSLDNWIDYLSSADATYPEWLKYYAFRNVIGMGEYDKEKKLFTSRSKGTTKPFPDIDREALAYVLDAIEKKAKKEQINLSHLQPTERVEFEQLLQNENFAKLYAYAIEQVTPASKDRLITTEGRWVKYDKGSDYMPLVRSLQGHGTGWCTAGESTAATQLKDGDFYVYYSLDERGEPTVPRAAIRMQQDNLAEVRGIAEQQNLDPYIGDVVKEKLLEFPDGATYEKKTKDMRHLTDIERKVSENEDLNREDLFFLYEIDKPIEGFGYKRDPRIAELRVARNIKQDIPIVFDCKPEQIAKNASEVNRSTKVYVGALFPGIFKENIEYIFTIFPEGKVREYGINIGGKDKDQLRKEFKEKKLGITRWTEPLLDSQEFTVAKTSEHIELIRLTVKDLGLPDGATTSEIYQRGKELGLELCPAEAGPNLRLQYEGMEQMYIAMKPIDLENSKKIFALGGFGDELGSVSASPTEIWDAAHGFIFYLRKPENDNI